MEPKKTQDPDELGGWRITGRLGEGGFGTVFLAEKGAQKAAVKVLKSEIADDAQARLNLSKEADVLSTLIDPAIGKIIDSDLLGETPWIATEFINGPTLDSKVRYEGPIEVNAWFNLAATLFHALVAAHNLGIIHKDVKPSNIILGETGTKLIDFGIAQVAGQRTRTMTIGGIEGSIPFSSPEHFTPKTYPAMDVFSAAVTLAYAGKGTSIWSGETELQLMRNINEDEPNLEGLKADQIEFLLPLLNKNPSDRPDSKDALKMALKYLEQYSSNEPTHLFDSWAKRRKPIKKGNSLLTATIIGTFALSFFALVAYAFTNQQNPDFKILIEPSVKASASSSPSATLKVVSKQSSSSADCEEAYSQNTQAISEKCLVSANAGDLRSIFYMGTNADQNGKTKVAEGWFLKAAMKDDISSMGALVQIYLNTKNTKGYSLWVSKCADYTVKTSAGAKCKLFLGLDLLRTGETTKGLLYLQDSYEYGNGSAATFIGIHYRDWADYETAIKWYVKAAEADDPTGINELIYLAHKLGKTDLYMKWLKISADDGNGTHAWMLATEYFSLEDYKNAEKYSQIGANAGDTSAMSLLGVILYKINNDIPSAKIWLKRGAAAEDIMSINYLGLISRVEDKNIIEALNWYKKSAALGDLEGMYWVGVVYAGGFGNGPAACTAFKSVITRTEDLKKSGKYETNSMDTWLKQSQEGTIQTC
jgi:serine/threonine protein kinase